MSKDLTTTMSATNHLARQCPDVLRWTCSKWNEVAGNQRAKKQFQRLVKNVRQSLASGRTTNLNRCSFLLTGPSRSGKTALVKLLVRCIVCQEFQTATLDPCGGHCHTCCQSPELAGLQGIWSHLAAYRAGSEVKLPVQFTTVDCTMITGPDELRNQLWTLGTGCEGIRVFYFDEVHRLARRGMDEMLLKAVEEKPAMWFFSTAKPDALEDMFTNRLLKVSTQLPTDQEMAAWLVDRCDDWRIFWEPEAIVRVIEKSNRVVGIAMHAIALASLNDDEGLSLDLVEHDWVVEIEG